jgi:glutaredoxin/cytochrome c biogenesis protein CcdA
MYKKNKILNIFALFILLLSVFSSFAYSQDLFDLENNNVILENDLDIESNQFNVYFFWGDGCPHCMNQKEFFDSIKDKYPNMILNSYEVWKNKDNQDYMKEVSAIYEVQPRGVPLTFIGNKNWIGFSSSIEQEIHSYIESCSISGCISPLEKLTKEKIETIQINDYESPLCIHLFIKKGCPQCDGIINYLRDLEEQNLIHLVVYDVDENEELYSNFKTTYGLEMAGYPVLFIGDYYFIGDIEIKKNIIDTIKKCSQGPCPCPVQNIKGVTSSIPKSDDYTKEESQYINLPLIGDVDISGMSLVIVTLLISFVDGFNPCSLWVLLFLLGIVINTRSRKKIFLVGLTFLIVTASAYGAFMLGLLKVFSYIMYLTWIRVIVVLIAITFALVNIKDYFWYKKGISFTISDKYKPTFFKKIRSVMDPNRSTFSIIGATALMALGITLVELPCTAGFPVIWINIIHSQMVDMSTYILLFLLYIFIYLIIEIIIFLSVVLTLKSSRFQEKHGRMLKLIGGIIMIGLAIGLLSNSDIFNTISGSVILFVGSLLVAIIIMTIHRYVLPKFGIVIGSEDIEVKNKNKRRFNKKESNNLESDIDKNENLDDKKEEDDKNED